MSGLDILFLGMLLIVLVPIAVIDSKERRIPNGLNLALAALGFIHAIVKVPEWHQVFLELSTMVLAALTFAGTAWIIQRINRNAKIGWGDLKFLTAASLWVGVDGSIAVLFAASVISLLIVSISSPWTRQSWRQPRPFGPMLAVGMMAVVTLTFTLNANP
jgi:leader peptidase (prepilin peptidase)/N-methyltransferase